MTIVTAKNYADVVSQRVSAERSALAARWLIRLNELLLVEPNAVFPSDQLLDHIPTLILEIAEYVKAPADEEIATNAAVIDKARELGSLRHEQRASVHQLLREYEILGELLERFVIDETERLALHPSPAECLEVFRRMTRATRSLMRTTVDTFVSQYTTTITERNERIKNFNRMASHELRTPIGTLLFASAMLNTDVIQLDSARVAQIASTISSNADRLSRLVTNLEKLSRLTDSQDMPSQQEVDLQALAAEVVRQVDEMATARDVVIRINATEVPPLLVDAARLELVLLNLVSNAIKYCDPGKHDRFIEVAASLTSDEMCAIIVRDNGLGIAEQDQAAIFDRFFRAHSHLDQALGVTGTGLGLAIVAECVRELDGSIRCESSLGSGTTFVISVPRRSRLASANSTD